MELMPLDDSNDLSNPYLHAPYSIDDLPGQLEDDPYGIILFDDIRPFIVSLYSQEARLQFVDCLMTFLGLPINSFAGSNGPQSATEHTNATNTGVVYNPYF